MSLAYRTFGASSKPLRKERGAVGRVPLLRDNALGGQAEDVESPIAYEAEVGGGGDGDARVEERRILYGVAIEALGAVFEHTGKMAWLGEGTVMVQGGKSIN